jgi:GTP cyclohydrolase II
MRDFQIMIDYISDEEQSFMINEATLEEKDNENDSYGTLNHEGEMLLQETFVETKLATKFGEFNIRVYPDSTEKETLLLWTEALDVTQPVIVRVHSECLTGDVLGSLQCDCGKQLAKSLQIIGEEGGVLIYLRQEGRGIGLFEKIKSYQLQSKGYDTFEANVLLGHHPDQRSYEMVKKILDDLDIKRIRLLTNNPSKISDIAKLGIDIVERIPLVSRPNKHNKTYLETKRKKFQHLSAKSEQHYFYQFHVDTVDQAKAIAEFIKNKKYDPFLKICVGISANHLSLTDKKEIERIKAIYQFCDHQNVLIPILHFSFRNSSDFLKDAQEIKNLLPCVKRLQINDLPPLETVDLKKISDLFSIDIPLSDKNFDLVYDKQFRELIKKNKSFILLDNSGGKGIKESKDSFKKKIDILLAYGLNDIALCGGFGPHDLDRYFELRRYYRVNFSIDAETNLKTEGKVDLEKIKLYLLQLIRFDDPKQQGIDQTRKFLEQHRRSDWEVTEIEEKEFLIHSKVFHAGHFPSTSWFASRVRELVKNETSFCEVGCGSGVISCLVAASNPKLEVAATDINPYASENTKLNAERLGLNERLAVFTGDVLDGVEHDNRFDSIFWALPFGFLDPGVNISLEEAQVFDPGYRAIRKFFQSAKNYLKPKGRLLIGFSSNLGHAELLEEIAKECSIKLRKIDEKIMKEDTQIQFEILEGRIEL